MNISGFKEDGLTLKTMILVLLILLGSPNILTINAFLSSANPPFFKNDVIEVNVGLNGEPVSDYAVVSRSNPVNVHVSVRMGEDVYVKSVEGEIRAKGWRGRLFLAALRFARIWVYVPVLNQKVLVENPKRIELNRDIKRFSVTKSVIFDPKEGYMEFLGMKMRLPVGVPSGVYYITVKAVYVVGGETKIDFKTFTLVVE